MSELVDALLVFPTVNLSMGAEKILRAAGVPFEVLPLPKEITRGCSIAIGVSDGILSTATDVLDRSNAPVEAVYRRVDDRWELAEQQDTGAPPRPCSIYLDNNSTTRPDPDVIRAVTEFLSRNPGNPSSVHSSGRRAREALENARTAVARLIGADASEIVFTSGGTESNNMALFGVATARGDGCHIVTAKTEHSSILEPCRRLEESGVRVTYLPVDTNGIVDLEALRSAVTRDTVLISIAYANNETGVIQPVREIAEIASRNNVLFHTDAVQAAGKIPLDVNRDGADLLSLSAHKFHGLKGTGALYVRKGVTISSIIYGGGQERGFRSGTENAPGIVAMGESAAIALDKLDETARRIESLRDLLHEGIERRFPWVKINGHLTRRLPNTLNLCFRDISGEEIVAFLDKDGICVSTGSACASGQPEPSHVLLAMGLTEQEARSSVRFSLGRETSGEDIERTVEAVTRVIGRYRELG
jgi:cysteine desulfurase